LIRGGRDLCNNSVGSNAIAVGRSAGLLGNQLGPFGVQLFPQRSELKQRPHL